MPPGMAAAPAARWWRGAVRGATRRAPRHHVYVIELDPTALTHAKFRAANPNHDPRKPPLYVGMTRSEEHTSELQSQSNLVCRLLLEKKILNITTPVTVWQYESKTASIL